MHRCNRRPAVLPAILLPAALALLLGACTGQAPGPAPAPAEPAPDTSDQAAMPDPLPVEPAEETRVCNADAVQDLVGQQADEAVVARATADSGSASVRVLGPGQPATMDFREDRLNILTDEAGVIEQLRCG